MDEQHEEDVQRQLDRSKREAATLRKQLAAMAANKGSASGTNGSDADHDRDEDIESEEEYLETPRNKYQSMFTSRGVVPTAPPHAPRGKQGPPRRVADPSTRVDSLSVPMRRAEDTSSRVEPHHTDDLTQRVHSDPPHQVAASLRQFDTPQSRRDNAAPRTLVNVIHSSDELPPEAEDSDPRRCNDTSRQEEGQSTDLPEQYSNIPHSRVPSPPHDDPRAISPIMAPLPLRPQMINRAASQPLQPPYTPVPAHPTSRTPAQAPMAFGSNNPMEQRDRYYSPATGRSERGHSSYPPAGSSPSADTHNTSRSRPTTLQVRGQKRPQRDRSQTPSEDESAPRARTKRPRYRDDQLPKGPPKASDYEPHVAKLIIRACREFEARICTENAFVDDAEEVVWAQEAWEAACESGNEEYDITDRIESIIKGRDSRIRGHVKEAVLQLIETTYGFKRDVNNRPDVVAANYETYMYLLGDSENPNFHWRDPKTQEDYAEHEIIFNIIQASLFRDRSDHGVTFPRYFSPIPLATYALVFTLIDLGITQYSTGKYVKAPPFAAATYQGKYKRYLRKLQDWSDIAPRVVENIRQDLHDRAREASGAPAVEQAPSGLSRTMRDKLSAQLAARAGRIEAGRASGNMNAASAS